MRFDPTASYESIHLPKPSSPKRPDLVAQLDLKKLELYKKRQVLIDNKYKGKLKEV